MRLTKQTDYAIRILMYCAANEGRLSCIPDIAAAYSISETFLFKILSPLKKGGIIQTVPGKNGGVKLARPATHITVADVVMETEENFFVAECFESSMIKCPLTDACGLNSTLINALKAFLHVLSETTIADLKRSTTRDRLGLDTSKEPRKLAS
ncbi:MAG: putative transcriptional regulator [Candidatus Tokpelaia sp. JSC085]|nr:MAG: putative transcriptional regulator [Candidatus Tokpelaia sp. JSC085]